MHLKESGEMYLESIYVLCKSKSSVRSIDVAEYMNYSKPSVSRAVGLLKSEGYISVDKDGYISLTEDGTILAQKIFERHTVLTKILMALGVDEKTASEDACRIEHVISEESFNAMKKCLEENSRS
jgi:Mn-dependent DtxR family transcriptional regulator